MRLVRTACAVALGLAVAALANTQPPAAQDAGRRAEELVRQLGSDNFAEREEAKKGLEALGEPALKALREAQKGPDAETSRRAADLVRHIEAKVLTARLLAPKRVHLKVADVSVESAVEALAKLSGYEIRVDGNRGSLADKKVTIDTGDVTFWEALDRLCAKAGLVERATVTATTSPSPSTVFPNLLIKPPNAPALRLRPAVPVQPPPPPPPPPAADPKAVPIAAEIGLAFVAAQVGDPKEPPAAPKAPPPPAVPKQLQAPALPPPPPALVQKGGFGGAVIIADEVAVDKPTSGYVLLVPGPAGPEYHSYAGAVRLTLRPQPAVGGKHDVMLDVSAEPRLQGFAVVGSPSVEKALDENGRALKVTTAAQPAPRNDAASIGPAGAPIVGLRHVPPSPLALQLEAGDPPAKRLKELSGSVSAVVQLPAQTLIQADDVMKAAGKSFHSKNGGSLRVDSVQQLPSGDYQLQFVMEDLQPNPVGARGLGVNGAVIVRGVVNGNLNGRRILASGMGPTSDFPDLFDAKGDKLPRAGATSLSTEINNNRITVRATALYRPNPGQGEPSRLVLTGTETATITIPFRFEDVPLP